MIKYFQIRQKDENRLWESHECGWHWITYWSFYRTLQRWEVTVNVKRYWQGFDTQSKYQFSVGNIVQLITAPLGNFLSSSFWLKVLIVNWCNQEEEEEEGIISKWVWPMKECCEDNIFISFNRGSSVFDQQFIYIRFSKCSDSNY